MFILKTWLIHSSYYYNDIYIYIYIERLLEFEIEHVLLRHPWKEYVSWSIRKIGESQAMNN